ncbi:MAG TPA: DUF3109 domain-containing protein [Cytophagales bacterium]|jgi:hypothetical protein|nr:DUF3109 domain-containing protein [Cytophagales bacterium]
MITIDNTIISDDLAESFFVCNLEKCKGACCVEGDLGAPLEKEELRNLEEIYEKVEPYLSEEGKQAIREQGLYIYDDEGDFSTPTVGGRECAYAIYDERGILKCGIEQAYNDGKTDFKKPISCHLYPVRITKYEQYDAVNYDRWEICAPACNFGKSLNVPLFEFLKGALTRKYGKKWYEELELKILEISKA